MTCESPRSQPRSERKPSRARFDAALILGLGSNLGRSEQILEWAIDQLRSLYGDVESAPFYRTAAISAQPQADFLNTVVVAPHAVRSGSAKSPIRVLEQLKELERRAGRKPSTLRDRPRTLDIDLLLFGRAHLDTADGRLRVPHPRLHQRRFVLQPLCDLDPNLTIPPREERVSDLLAALPSDQRVDRQPA